MRFLDPKIRINITNKSDGRKLSFKAFLEKNDISYQVQEANLEYAPISLPNDSIVTRILQSIDFSFNVFSETRNEAIENYEKLHSLIDFLKPEYTEVGGQLIPNQKNSFGQITLNFSGLPKISKSGDELGVVIKNFSYSINQDMGYIELPYDNTDRRLFRYFDSGMRLVPIAYKVSIGGRLALAPQDTTIILPDAAARQQQLDEQKINEEVAKLLPKSTSTPAASDAYIATITKGLSAAVGKPGESMFLIYGNSLPAAIKIAKKGINFGPDSPLPNRQIFNPNDFTKSSTFNHTKGINRNNTPAEQAEVDREFAKLKAELEALKQN